MVKTEINAIHLAAFVNQPVATPHQPRYAQQLPPGGSQEEVAGAGTIQFTHLFRKQQADSSRPYRAYAFNRVLAEIRGYGRLRAAPTGAEKNRWCDVS